MTLGRPLAEHPTVAEWLLADSREIDALAGRHRARPAAASGIALDRDQRRLGVHVQLRYQLANRIAWQWLFAAAIPDLGYVPRITAVVAGLVRQP